MPRFSTTPLPHTKTRKFLSTPPSFSPPALPFPSQTSAVPPNFASPLLRSYAWPLTFTSPLLRSVAPPLIPDSSMTLNCRKRDTDRFLSLFSTDAGSGTLSAASPLLDARLRPLTSEFGSRRSFLRSRGPQRRSLHYRKSLRDSIPTALPQVAANWPPDVFLFLSTGSCRLHIFI